MYNIQQGKNRFFIEDNGEMLAEITFLPLKNEQIDVNHTFVSDKLRGQGIAGQLLDRVVQYAREEKKMIVPTCSYAAVKMERKKDYHDVLAK
ncbi:putative GNAT family acetyltransferase [Oikeobacillus pervagus]|uniref:GNAT family acetyltransferase n=1 Tax=Oikeobacillus pervagus TaxID=1325931 RepID=A0AAJ1WHT8_9BACI|nr:GNAT family N-acetyltransferase [Oikeobacillus pervagus]MDQ0213960.1 putative GNAT family acetyltransferase [Oikeobacillus pervagus]